MSYFCNTAYMPIFEGKRLEFVGVKLNDSEKKAFGLIASDEDRAMSYVVRELALRGFVQYLKDRRVKATDEEIEIAKQLLTLKLENNLPTLKMVEAENLNELKTPKIKKLKTG